MNDEAVNVSIRKFLKMVGVNSQRSIEQALAKATADGTIANVEVLPASVVLQIPGLNLSLRLDGEIRLE